LGTTASQMSGRQTRGLRIRTQCTTLDELVRVFYRFCDETSIFVPTPSPRQEGIEAAFSIDLANGESALVGQGVVLGAWTTRDNRFGQAGMQIGVRKVTPASVKVYEQLLIARALAKDTAQSQRWDDGTDVGGPNFDDRQAVPQRAIDLVSAPIEGAPSASAKHTLLGLPIIPHAPAAPAPVAATPVAAAPVAPAPAATAPVAAAPRTASPAQAVQPMITVKPKLSPNAFNIGVPARIVPKNGVARTVEPSPSKARPELARASQPALARPAVKLVAPVVARGSRPAMKDPEPAVEPAVPEPITLEPAVMLEPAVPEPITLVPAVPEPITLVPAVPEPITAVPEPIAAEPDVPEAAPVAESQSARAPRAGTVLGSGPVPRLPAGLDDHAEAYGADSADAVEPPYEIPDPDDDARTPVNVDPELTERDVVNHFALAAHGLAPPVEIAPIVAPVPVDEPPSIDEPMPRVNAAAVVEAAPAVDAVPVIDAVPVVDEAPVVANEAAPVEPVVEEVRAIETQPVVRRRRRRSFAVAIMAVAVVCAAGGFAAGFVMQQRAAQQTVPAAAPDVDVVSLEVPTEAPTSEVALEPAVQESPSLDSVPPQAEPSAAATPAVVAPAPSEPAAVAEARVEPPAVKPSATRVKPTVRTSSRPHVKPRTKAKAKRACDDLSCL